MKNMVKAGKVVTKVCEVFHWVGTAMLLAATICSLAAPAWVKYFVGVTAREGIGAELNVYGFEILAPVVEGQMDMHAFFLFGVGAVIILALMAMVFRNLNLMMKKAEESTPFQPDNVRMCREIGIFTILVPVVGLVMSTVCRIVLGAVETSVDLSGIFMGIIVLSLTQFFVYGMQLEKDVDGLL